MGPLDLEAAATRISSSGAIGGGTGRLCFSNWSSDRSRGSAGPRPRSQHALLRVVGPHIRVVAYTARAVPSTGPAPRSFTIASAASRDRGEAVALGRRSWRPARHLSRRRPSRTSSSCGRKRARCAGQPCAILARWDAGLYLKLAQEGYPRHLTVGSGRSTRRRRSASIGSSRSSCGARTRSRPSGTSRPESRSQSSPPRVPCSCSGSSRPACAVPKSRTAVWRSTSSRRAPSC